MHDNIVRAFVDANGHEHPVSGSPCGPEERTVQRKCRNSGDSMSYPPDSVDSVHSRFADSDRLLSIGPGDGELVVLGLVVGSDSIPATVTCLVKDSGIKRRADILPWEETVTHLLGS